MTPGAVFTVHLISEPSHPETGEGGPSVRFRVPTFWMPGPSQAATGIRRIRFTSRLAPEQIHTFIPRRVYQDIGMRIDGLSARPYFDWCGVACYLGRARFGLFADERPRSQGERTDLKRPLVPLETQVVLPETDPPWVPGHILFGGSFFVQYRARLRLDYAAPYGGQIILPQS